MRTGAPDRPSIRELARRTVRDGQQLSYGYLAALEAGRERNPSDDVLDRIATGLQLTAIDRRKLSEARTADTLLVVTGADVPTLDAVKDQANAEEIWILVESPVEIRDDAALQAVVDNIQKNEVHYVYFLHTKLCWQAQLGPVLKDKLGERFYSHVRCIIVKGSELGRLLFLPPRSIHLRDQKPLVGTWVKLAAAREIDAVYKMDESSLASLFEMLAPIVAGLQRNKEENIPIDEPLVFQKIHPPANTTLQASAPL